MNRETDAGSAYGAEVRRANAYALSRKPLTRGERQSVVEAFSDAGINEVWIADASDRADFYFFVEPADVSGRDVGGVRSRLQSLFPGSKVEIGPRPAGAPATRIHMLDDARPVDRALGDLSIPWGAEADRDSDSWAEFVELEAKIAGWLNSVRDSGTVPTNEISVWRARIATRSEWLERWPDRVARLERACSVLANVRDESV